MGPPQFWNKHKDECLQILHIYEFVCEGPFSSSFLAGTTFCTLYPSTTLLINLNMMKFYSLCTIVCAFLSVGVQSVASKMDFMVLASGQIILNRHSEIILSILMRHRANLVSAKMRHCYIFKHWSPTLAPASGFHLCAGCGALEQYFHSKAKCEG